VQAQAQSYGVTATVDFVSGYPVLVNTKEETDFARAVACELVGESNVNLSAPPLTGSEDFAFMLEQLPGCYLLIGNGDQSTGGHGACMVHNSNYDFNDHNMSIGSAYWVLLAERFLV
jgi:hippurate hydrolase